MLKLGNVSVAEANEALGEDKSENIIITVNSISEAYPDESHFSVAKRIIKDKRIVIEEGSPIFDALLLRIRAA